MQALCILAGNLLSPVLSLTEKKNIIFSSYCYGIYLRMSHHHLIRNQSLSSGSSVTTSAAAFIPSETDEKCRKAVGRLSENLYIMGNEPSLALYCLQEHVRKEVPNMIKQKADFGTQYRLLQGTCYDCDYSIGAVKSMMKSQEQFSSIQNHLKNTLFLKQQLKFDENRRRAAVKGASKKK